MAKDAKHCLFDCCKAQAIWEWVLYLAAPMSLDLSQKIMISTQQTLIGDVVDTSLAISTHLVVGPSPHNIVAHLA